MHNTLQVIRRVPDGSNGGSAQLDSRDMMNGRCTTGFHLIYSLPDTVKRDACEILASQLAIELQLLRDLVLESHHHSLLSLSPLRLQ